MFCPSENLSDHLTGNVYAKFREEEDAEAAFKALMVHVSCCRSTRMCMQHAYSCVLRTPRARSMTKDPSLLRKSACEKLMLPVFAQLGALLRRTSNFGPVLSSD